MSAIEHWDEHILQALTRGPKKNLTTITVPCEPTLDLRDGAPNFNIRLLDGTFDLRPAVGGFGRSRGGFTSKIYAPADGQGHPLGFILTGGEVSDYKAVPALLTFANRSA